MDSKPKPHISFKRVGLTFVCLAGCFCLKIEAVRRPERWNRWPGGKGVYLEAGSEGSRNQNPGHIRRNHIGGMHIVFGGRYLLSSVCRESVHVDASGRNGKVGACALPGEICQPALCH